MAATGFDASSRFNIKLYASLFAGHGDRACACGLRRGGSEPSGDAELGAMQPGIEAAFGDELVMASRLDDAALIEHADQIGLLHRRQAVSDHQHGAAAHQLLERD